MAHPIWSHEACGIDTPVLVALCLAHGLAFAVAPRLVGAWLSYRHPVVAHSGIARSRVVRRRSLRRWSVRMLRPATSRPVSGWSGGSTRGA